MMRKFAPCGGASAVISWMRLIFFTRVSISWLTLATAAVVTDVASTSAMRKRPEKRAHGRARDRRHATQLRKWRDAALRGAAWRWVALLARLFG